MAKAIGADGLEVVSCDSAEAAAAATSSGVVVIVADVSSVGGWEGLAALAGRHGEAGNPVPVLALVQGPAEKDAQTAADRIGGVTILCRPMSAATLRSAVVASMPAAEHPSNPPARAAA